MPSFLNFPDFLENGPPSLAHRLQPLPELLPLLRTLLHVFVKFGRPVYRGTRPALPLRTGSLVSKVDRQLLKNIVVGVHLLEVFD
jgi:hypothetical protein